jgi:hypothetical protein
VTAKKNGYMRKENKKIVISATNQLQNLWEKGVFKVAKKISEIDTCLAKDGYNFTPAELGMGLKRAAYLTRKGKRGAYTYIQKGPYLKHDK